MMKEINIHRKFFHTMKFTMLLVNALVLSTPLEEIGSFTEE